MLYKIIVAIACFYICLKALLFIVWLYAPNFLKGYKIYNLNTELSKTERLFAYLAVIAVCVYTIVYKLST